MKGKDFIRLQKKQSKKNIMFLKEVHKEQVEFFNKIGRRLLKKLKEEEKNGKKES